MRRRTLLVAIALGLVLIPSSVWSHHSPVVFDQTREITLAGEVTGFRWTNPHAWIELRVEGPEGDEIWDIELNGAQHLIRAGWTKTTLEFGDEVEIAINPLRTGDPVGKFVALRLSDGTVLTER